jgi:uncharacterized protein (TIGR00251 family)
MGKMGVKPAAKRTDSRTPLEGPTTSWLREDDAGVQILIHLQPGARRTGVAGEFNGRLKIAVSAPPLEGRANAALRDWLARQLGVPGSSIRIVSGMHGRDKTLRIDGIDAARARRLLMDK